MASRPTTAQCDGVDLSQHIKNAALMATTKLPGGVKPPEFVVRYTSEDTTNNPEKQCTDGDITACRSARLSLVLVHEEGAEAAKGSYAAGQGDARQALTFIRSKGMPPDTVVHCAIDFAATGPDIINYVRGFTETFGPGRRAAYGGITALAYLLDHGLLDYAWQTYAWSGGRWDSRITAAQWLNGQPFAGNTVDYDSACAVDYGQLGPDWTSTDRDVPMSVVDLTPDAVNAVRDAILNFRVDTVAPPVGPDGKPADTPADVAQVLRQMYFRSGYVANKLPAVIQGWIAPVLTQAQANGSGISALQQALTGLLGEAVAVGITPEQVGALLRAAADAVNPPVATS